MLSRALTLLLASALAIGCSSEGSNGGGGGTGAVGSQGSVDDSGPGEVDGTATSGAEASGTNGTSMSDPTGGGPTDGGPTGGETEVSTSDSGSGSTGEGDDPVGPSCELIECNGDVVWSRRYGNSVVSASSEAVTAIATDPAGNTVIGGTINGIADFGDLGTIEGPGAGFVAQVGPDGELQWVRELSVVGDAAGLSVRSIAVDDDGSAVVVGSATGELIVDGQTLEGSGSITVLKFDENGSLSSGQLFGSQSGLNAAHAVATDEEGRIGVVGEFRNSVHFGGNQMSALGGAQDVFVAVFDPDLNHVWSRHFGDDAAQTGHGVGFTEGGDVAVSLRNWGTVSFGGAESHTTTGLASMVVARLEADDGEEVWSRQYAPSAGLGAPLPRIVATPDAIYLGTYSSEVESIEFEFDFGLGPSDGLSHVVRLDPNGNAQWDRPITGLRGGVLGLARDSGDGLLIAGLIEGTVDFGNGPLSSTGRDGFVAKYDAHTGDLIWGRLVTDDDQQTVAQQSHGVSTDAAGHVYVGGSFNGVIDFGDGDLVSSGGFGGADGFLAKLMP